jgi:hypothetical protein
MTYRLRSQGNEEALAAADRAAARFELPHCIRKSSDRQRITTTLPPDGQQNVKDGCNCTHGLCRNLEPPAVRATRARFSESFCREQARLVEQLGPPRWMRRGIVAHFNSERLRRFWEEQAEIAQSNAP